MQIHTTGLGGGCTLARPTTYVAYFLEPKQLGSLMVDILGKLTRHAEERSQDCHHPYVLGDLQGEEWTIFLAQRAVGKLAAL